MSIKTDTVKGMIEKIDSNEILLPAMQRKLVWKEKQVLDLFDSIMRGFPFGSFLLWNISDKQLINKYRFYKFVKDYSEKYGTMNVFAGKVGKDRISVVMDGQQRLSALYMGIKGSRERLVRPGVFKNKSENWRITHLYFKPCVELEERNEDDQQYVFEFLEDSVAEFLNKDKEPQFQYYMVSDFYNMTKAELREKLGVGQIRENSDDWKYQLELLRNNLNDKKILEYHEIINQDISSVLEIFKRINNGGTALSPADLMFSTIITTWEPGREKIEQLITKIREDRLITLREDTIVRMSLYVLNVPANIKIEMLTQDIVNQIKDNWVAIESAIIKAKQFLVNHNLSDSIIKSYNALFPIAYYYYYAEKMTEKVEEEFVKFFTISQLFGLFGGTSTSTLEKVRAHLCKKGNLGDIDADFKMENLFDIDLSAGRNNAFKIRKDQVEKIMDSTSYGDSKAYLLMCLLYPNVKVEAGNYDLDHVCSKDETKRFVAYKRDEALKKELNYLRDSIYNLQLLDSSKNRGDKNKDPLYVWVVEKKNQVEYDPFREKDKNLYKLESIQVFKDFCLDRRKMMIEYLCKKLGG